MTHARRQGAWDPSFPSPESKFLWHSVAMEAVKKTEVNQAVLSLTDLPKHIEEEGSHMLMWQAYKLKDVTGRQADY